MIPRKTAAAASRRRLRLPLAALLAAAATGLLLAVLPQPARAATGDFEIGAGVGADGAAYLVRGGLQTCDSTNNCTGGLTPAQDRGDQAMRAQVAPVREIPSCGAIKKRRRASYLDVKSRGC